MFYKKLLISIFTIKPVKRNVEMCQNASDYDQFFTLIYFKYDKATPLKYTFSQGTY